MKSTIARAKPQKGFHLGDHGTHSKLVSGGKKAFLKKLFFFNRPNLHDAPDRRRRLPLQAYGLSRIEIVTPQATLPYTSTSVWEDSTLADPTFRSPGKVEAILGADVFSDIVLPGVMRRDNILAQSTIFGWILTGTTRARDRSLSNLDGRSTFTLATGARSTEECTHHEILIELVRRFWALEEVPHIRTISQADVDCEEQFVKGFFRQADGRYVVPLPLKEDGVSLLSENFPAACATLSSMHRRMQQDAELASAYRIQVYGREPEVGSYATTHTS